MVATAHRNAKMKLTRNEHGTMLNVSVPRDVSAEDFAKLHRVIVGDVIKNLTGCPCLSGQVRVVLEDDLQEVIRVDLASGKIEG